MTRRLARAASLSSLVAMGLCACGRAPAPLTPPTPGRPAATAPSAPALEPIVTTAALEQPSTPLPPWIGRVESPACSWGTDRWSRRVITTLRLRPGGPVFARVAGGKAQVHIPVGSGGQGTLDVGSNGLVVTGFVERAHVVLFAASEFAMNGVLFPRSTTPLTWKEGFSDGVSVTMDTPVDIVVNNPPLTARRPCGDLTLDGGATLAPAKAAFGMDYGDQRMLRAGTVEVFSDPSRPADIKLVLTERAYVASFATSGAFSRIGFQRSDVYVAGWVRTANLGESWNGGQGWGTGSSAVGIGTGPVRPLRKVVCSTDVPVVAEAAGERATVGHVMTGTIIDVADETGAFSHIRIANRSILPAEAGSFLARSSDLKRCETLAP